MLDIDPGDTEGSEDERFLNSCLLLHTQCLTLLIYTLCAELLGHLYALIILFSNRYGDPSKSQMLINIRLICQ